jgi:peptidyl-prolyl cis-trans isomerase A (cyclophilin A)
VSRAGALGAAGVIVAGLRILAADAALPAGLDLKPGWYAHLETSRGSIVVRLLPEQSPQAVAHFAALAQGGMAWVDPLTGVTRKEPYYDGIEVHLAEAAQRFEAGDRTGTGRGAPPFYLPDEGAGPVNFSRPGRIGMTRSSRGRVSAVQFFVTAVGTPWLNGRHPCFGEVVHGLDVVRAISDVKTGPRKKPIEPVLLARVRIHAVGEPPPLPVPVPFTPKPPVFEKRQPAADQPAGSGGNSRMNRAP